MSGFFVPKFLGNSHSLLDEVSSVLIDSFKRFKFKYGFFCHNFNLVFYLSYLLLYNRPKK